MRAAQQFARERGHPYYQLRSVLCLRKKYAHTAAAQRDIKCIDFVILRESTAKNTPRGLPFL